MFPDLVAQAVPRDAQHAGGRRLVSPGSFQGARDQPPLASLQRKIFIRVVTTRQRADACDLGREAGQSDQRGLLQHHGPLHGIAQLAYVARPGVQQQGGDGILRKAPDFALEAPVVDADEMPGQRQDVRAPLAQRRNDDLDDVEAIEQVHAKGATVHGCHQILVGSRHETQIDVKIGQAANAAEAAALQNAQQLGLHPMGELPDFVQKHGSVIRHFQQSGLGSPRIRERAPLVAEQFALKQSFRDRRAVHGNKAHVAPAAVPVQDVGDDILAHASLALQQDGADFADRQALHELQHLTHRPGCGDAIAIRGRGLCRAEAGCSGGTHKCRRILSGQDN